MSGRACGRSFLLLPAAFGGLDGGVLLRLLDPELVELLLQLAYLWMDRGANE